MPTPKISDDVVKTVANMARSRILAKPGRTESEWIPVGEIAHGLGIKVEDLKMVLRRPSVKNAFAQTKVKYALRGTHLYVYVTDMLPAPARLDKPEKETDMDQQYSGGGNGGQITLTPGVVAKIPSSSDPHKDHEVRLSKNGLVYCDCEGFRWRGHCSHIDTLIGQNPGAKMMVKAGLREKIAHLQKVIETLDKE